VDNGQKKTEELIEVYVSQVYIYYTCGIFWLRIIKISDYGGKEHEKKDSKSTGVRNDINGIDE